MNLEVIINLALVLLIVMANLPWLTSRFLLVIPVAQEKSFFKRFLEWLIYLLLAGVVMFGLETKAIGEVFEQDWEFYAVAICLFALFAFPGFIYRYIYRSR